MNTHLIKIYHSFNKGKIFFGDFLVNVGKILKNDRLVFGFNYNKGELFYSISTDSKVYQTFESQFYTNYDKFQIIEDSIGVWKFNPQKAVLGEIRLNNRGFFPFKKDDDDSTDFIFNIFRTIENFDVINDKMGFFVDIKPIVGESSTFFLKSKLSFLLFKFLLFFKVFKYIFNFKIQRNWKQEGFNYFKEKLNKELFEVRIFIILESTSKDIAENKIKAVFNNFMTFKNYPLNAFNITFHRNLLDFRIDSILKLKIQKNTLSSSEIVAFFHFPKESKNETALLKVKSIKLALPIGVPTLNFKKLSNAELEPILDQNNMNSLGISDYRSINVPIGIYDEDRLRHTYIIGKTGVGKSKFLVNLMKNDILKGKGFGVIDPHGDLVEEVMMNMTKERLDDIIIFDPTDEKYPFCFNPLDVKEDESKQVIAKGFIDVFKKFFGVNWNSKLEHVLRMIFLALLDKKDATLFDVIRALTDKDFRYKMISTIEDDVVRNFWTNEFASWSQQFNTEAIMPILNKIGQLLSVDILKNIFASHENKLDFRKIMDEKKILIIKLPKGKLQEEIMGFLGAMFITKIYQTSMARQSTDKESRTPFFLYVDEFQNFATETFNEILSEARKYGLGLTIAHQYIKQIPDSISNSLFGNVGNLVCFRISSEDAGYMKQHFDPFIDGYDLANLNAREFYSKILVNGQVKDPFSMKTIYTPDVKISKEAVNYLYNISRKKYARTLEEAKVVLEQQKDVIEKLEEFAEPIV
ncbi:MAG: type IV secretion system DNA-binding domain-containing protein [Candidatus Gracilibacteria bacterium]|nr:type IV secretion system DNA-binding domain-containing protein [Candidatus Gracilibacteria bacterium]